MIETIKIAKNFLWDYILLFALVGAGIYMTVLLNFPQFSRVFPAIKKLFKDIKENKPVEPGRMTPFQSLATSVAAQVGTGNIVGVATAIALGGPGAAFWMLISAFFGMSTIFTEAVLAQIYRSETLNGELVGGPAYYIEKGLNSKWLSRLFAVFTIIALGVVGIIVQANSIVTSLEASLSIPNTWATIGLMVLVGIILTGGMDRIAGFSEKVVPLMAGAYITGSLIIVFMNLDVLVPTIQMIFIGAFTPQAISGGALGIGIQQAIRYGVARGLFSNEAGLGSTPHSHAVAHSEHPAEQGFMAMIGVFVATFLICTSTVMINVMSGAYDPTVSAEVSKEGATLMTQHAFEIGFGKFGEIFLSLSLSSFAFTTIVGWYFFAESNVKLIFKDNNIAVILFKVLAMVFILISPRFSGDEVWTLSDFFTGLMALPNIIALVILAKEAKWILDNYDECKLKDDIHWPDIVSMPWKEATKK